MKTTRLEKYARFRRQRLGLPYGPSAPPCVYAGQRKQLQVVLATPRILYGILRPVLQALRLTRNVPATVHLIRGRGEGAETEFSVPSSA